MVNFLEPPAVVAGDWCLTRMAGEFFQMIGCGLGRLFGLVGKGNDFRHDRHLADFSHVRNAGLFTNYSHVDAGKFFFPFRGVWLNNTSDGIP